MPYEIQFAESVESHLEVLTVAQRKQALEAIGIQLAHEPLKETRNRKPLRPNPIAPWELRVGALRVFYDVVDGPPQVVNVLAVGIKDRNQLRIGGEEVKL
jgi:mRNA-degrading endonuclease RelE of RelBE toxin-antitoxin system